MTEAQIKALAILNHRPHLLWANVDKSGDCWTWTATLNPSGYGSVRVGTTSILAHRAAYLLSGGTLGKGDCVCHRCDNPKCCNPSHLFISDHRGNMGDMRQKGRRKGIGTGTANGRAKLTAKFAAEIREKKANGALLRELAPMYGVGLSTIGRACRGENWT